MNKATKIFTKIGSAAALLVLSAATAYAQAEVMPSKPDGAVGGDVDIKDIIGLGSTYLLSLAGGLAVLFLVIGGVMYTTAGGSDEKVQKARKYMMNAIVGLVVVVLAFVIVANTLKVTYRLDDGGSSAVTLSPATQNITLSSGSTSFGVTCSSTCPDLSAVSSNPAAISVLTPTVTGGSSTTASFTINFVNSGTTTITVTGSGGATATAVVN